MCFYSKRKLNDTFSPTFHTNTIEKVHLSHRKRVHLKTTELHRASVDGEKRFANIALKSHAQMMVVLISQRISIFDCIRAVSFECRKVIGFAFTTLRDWLKKLAPLFHSIRSKTKTNRDSLVPVFPRFASATCNYFVF